MATLSNGRKEKDDPLMKMYEAQAMVVEKEEELDQKDRELQQQRVKLENALQEIERLRQINEQQRFDQEIATTERKFEKQLAETRRQFEETLKESMANIEDKMKIDKKNYQENMSAMKQSTEENKTEARRLLERERDDRVSAVRTIEAQLAEKGETIRQHFETQIESLKRKVYKQSGEIENLRTGQLEKTALVEKANEETKKMMGNIAIQLKNVSSELGFYSSALILGGYHDIKTDSILIFDSKENKWQMCKQKLPFAVTYHGSAILNGNIYIMGGNHLSEELASCYKLGENGEWTKMADMNEKRCEISQSTIVFDSEIWVIGGWNGSDALKTVEKYNPQTNIWTEMPDLNFKRGASSASIVGGKIFVSGGSDGKRLKSVEFYDPAENKWEIFCDMPLELNGHCSIVEGTNLIIIGGRKYDGMPSDEVWKIDIFDPKKEWIKMPSLKQRRFSHGAVKLSNGIMVFGGSIDATTRIDSVEIFDGISWKEGPKLPEIHSAFSSIPLSIETEEQLLLQLF